MEIVNWSFITSNSLNGIDHSEHISPLIDNKHQLLNNLSKDIVNTRKGATYLKCPAHTDFLKNTFVFCAPFDLTINIDIDTNTDTVKIYCDNISQEIFDSLIDTRFLFNNEKGNNPYPLLGIDWLTIFMANSDMLMQVFPAFMHHNDFTNKTSVIPGEYKINNWTRPVELVFEIQSNQERIEIKKGDALSYIKFHCDDQIKLEKIDTPWNELQTCNNIRNLNTFRPLKERYQALDEIRANKCPYDHIIK